MFKRFNQKITENLESLQFDKENTFINVGVASDTNLIFFLKAALP